MKLFITAIAFAALLASPALAQQPYGPYLRYGPGYQAYGYQVGPYPGPAYEAYGYAGPAYGAFGFVPPGRSLDPRFDVYNTRGRYVGSDPDPRIRNDLARDPPNTD